MPLPDRTKLRQFINKHFNISELKTFSFDYFPAVVEELGDNPRKSVFVLELIEYSERHGKYSDLIVALEQERSDLFSEQFGTGKMASRLKENVTESAKRNPKQIFLSHSAKDGAFANQLAQELRAEGWLVWIAPESINAGEKWVDAIQRGLDESGIFVLLTSPNAVESQWVKSETNVAIGLEHNGDMRVLPVTYKSASVPSLWNNYQAIPFTSINARSLDRLFDALEGKPSRPKKATKRSEKTSRRSSEKGKEVKPDFAMMFVAAEKAYEIGDMVEAQKLFRRICDLDPNGVWAKNVQVELDKVEAKLTQRVFEEDRRAEYAQVKIVAEQSKRAGEIAWADYMQKYPDFDPDELAKTFEAQERGRRVRKAFVVLIGAPGAGKTTQAKLLQEQLGLPLITIGDFFVNSKPEMGLAYLVKTHIDHGDPAPHEVNMAMVKNRLAQSDCLNGAILDGFPRSVAQAEVLNELLVEFEGQIDVVPFIHVDQETLIERLLKRAEIEGRADDDDNEKTIRNRMNVYQESIAPLLDYYSEKGLVVKVDGDRAFDEVNNDLISVIRGK